MEATHTVFLSPRGGMTGKKNWEPLDFHNTQLRLSTKLDVKKTKKRALLTSTGRTVPDTNGLSCLFWHSDTVSMKPLGTAVTPSNTWGTERETEVLHRETVTYTFKLNNAGLHHKTVDVWFPADAIKRRVTCSLIAVCSSYCCDRYCKSSFSIFIASLFLSLLLILLIRCAVLYSAHLIRLKHKEQSPHFTITA